ncbi:spore germination lipoprotein GerD [Staphylospora marina]|uniref:spore germination lipoprotein GerD n=1 Tax=Staphylospora marina TaxID=2490858 RepID=UPI000F5C0CDB|nr:spore germination lipoprotein GerD [Staphylospora marina]
MRSYNSWIHRIINHLRQNVRVPFGHRPHGAAGSIRQILTAALILPVFLFTLVSCGSGQQSQQQEPDYQKIKEITLDVLHTQEGKKVLQDLMSDPSFKQQIALNSQEMEKALAKSFTDEKTKKEWDKILQKPEVAAGLAKASEEKLKQLMKAMMKDPEYQKMMMDLLKDPQFTQHMLQLMKSQQFRQETMKIMEELMKVPSIQQKLAQLLKGHLAQPKQGHDNQPQSESGSTVEGEGGA